jgi:hypothetical protein
MLLQLISKIKLGRSPDIACAVGGLCWQYFAGDLHDRKSCSGCLVFLNDALVYVDHL